MGQQFIAVVATGNQLDGKPLDGATVHRGGGNQLDGKPLNGETVHRGGGNQLDGKPLY